MHQSISIPFPSRSFQLHEHLEKNFIKTGLREFFFSPPFGFFPYISKADRAGYSCWKLRYSMAGPHEKKPLFFHNRKPYRWDSYGGRLIVRGEEIRNYANLSLSYFCFYTYLSVFRIPNKVSQQLLYGSLQFNSTPFFSFFVFFFCPPLFPPQEAFHISACALFWKAGGKDCQFFWGDSLFWMHHPKRNGKYRQMLRETMLKNWIRTAEYI